VESEGIEQVQLDPVIAEILGQQVGTRAFYRLNYFPSLRVALLGRFRKSNAGFSYQRLIRPGNGIILTARTENWNTYYSYTGVRKWTFTGSYIYYNLTGVLRFQQSNAIHLAGIRAGYQIRPRLQALFGVEGRIVQINTPNQFLRDGARPTFGFSYSPGEIPLALW
jgi:hypothetical protein